jgi:hypothetical protein
MTPSRSFSLPFEGMAGVGMGSGAHLPHPRPDLAIEGGGEVRGPHLLPEVGGVVA